MFQDGTDVRNNRESSSGGYCELHLAVAKQQPGRTLAEMLLDFYTMDDEFRLGEDLLGSFSEKF